MNELKIVVANVKVTKEVFKDAMQNTIDHFSSNSAEDFSYNITTITSKQGKQLYKITLLNDTTSGNEMEFYCEQNPLNGNMVFGTVRFDSLPGGFYKYTTSDEDEECNPLSFLVILLDTLCNKQKGTFGYIKNGVPSLFIKGVKNTNLSLGIIDINGTAYGFNQRDDDEQLNMVNGRSTPISPAQETGEIKVPMTEAITEFIRGNREAAKIVSDTNLNFQQKGDGLALLVMSARTSNKISPNSFISLMIQIKSLFGITLTNGAVTTVMQWITVE